MADPAAAHFHAGLAVDEHDLRFRWEAGTVLAEERFVLRNAGREPYGGRVYAWLPEGADLTRFGPPGAEPVRNGSGLVAYDLVAAGLFLEPNATLALEVAWSAPLAEGAQVARRLAYDAAAVRAVADAPLQVLAAPGAGGGRFGDEVRVAAPPPPGVEGWQVLLGLAAALLAGAWWWDRRRAA